MSDDKKKPGPLQRAWAAGIIDAKGIFPKDTNVVRIETTDEVLINRFRETVGVGNVTSTQKQAMVQPQFIYQSQSMDDTRELLLLVVPFLSARKLKQAAEVIARIERNPMWRKKFPEKAQKLVVAKEATDARS